MTLNELIKHLTKIQKAHKDNGDKEVVYSVDDEGNAYHSIFNEPSILSFSKDYEPTWDVKNGIEKIVIN